MIVINMPGGVIQEIDEDELLWFRKAFASEWRGTTMILLASDRLYSTEDLSELTEKFSNAEVPLAEFAAPDARLKVLVNAKKVRNVIESNPAIYHEDARSVLVFSNKLKLAVRNSLDDTRERIEAAKGHV